jgi:hypothetical protein
MMTILALLAAASAAAPQPTELKTFDDWTVGCDNGRACHAVALMAEDWPEDGLTMSVKRGPEAGAAPVIGFELGESSGATALEADGRRLPVRLVSADLMVRVDTRDITAVLAAMRSAERLEVLGVGVSLGTVSLKGASAALLYMDEKQQRVDTETALVRSGPKPAKAVPPPPALPVVRPAPAGNARIAFGAPRLKALRKQAGCTLDEVGGPDSFELTPLDARRSLLLLACGSGAYNVSYVPYLLSRKGAKVETRVAAFDAEESWWGEEGKPVLINAGWDSERRLLTSFGKGRGLGDCGTGRDYAWDGARFRLVHQYQMDECRGSTDYITTWRAEVEAR